jgi:chromosome segregation ATPase
LGWKEGEGMRTPSKQMKQCTFCRDVTGDKDICDRCHNLLEAICDGYKTNNWQSQRISALTAQLAEAKAAIKEITGGLEDKIDQIIELETQLKIKNKAMRTKSGLRKEYHDYILEAEGIIADLTAQLEDAIEAQQILGIQLTEAKEEVGRLKAKMKTFEEYWENYGELHAAMCGGDIKQFAKEIWQSAVEIPAKKEGEDGI